MFEGNVVLGTTFWRHMLGITNGHGEDSSEARVTHAVLTGKLRGF